MVQHRTLDWRKSEDPRNMAFLLSLQDCWGKHPFKRQQRHWRKAFLDQGSEGACTGFGEEITRNCHPWPQDTSNALAHAIYMRAKQLDEWPGENYDGSSVNGAQKAARERGFNRGWHWAVGLNEVLHGASYHGAGELGTKWWTGMFQPDSNGFIYPTGKVEGGHAICYAGYRLLPDGSRAHRLENSWGEAWGDHGGAWVHEENFMQLLNDGGELAFPVKVHSGIVTTASAGKASVWERIQSKVKGMHV